MSRMNEPNVAVIGCGNWGKNLVRNFAALGALRVVCDSDPRRRQAVEEQFPAVRTTASSPETLRDPHVQAVVIASPAATHSRIAREALEADKDVFVEKPLALTVADGQSIVALARERNRILMVGHLLRYHPGVLRLKALVDSGDL